MKITIYELLGLIKDGKAPKKVLIKDKVYYLLIDKEHYVYSQSKDIRQWDYFIDHRISISQNLDLEVLVLEDNDTVEILEEEKKIPEKLEQIMSKRGKYNSINDLAEEVFKAFEAIDDLIINQNQLIDYLKSKGDE